MFKRKMPDYQAKMHKKLIFAGFFMILTLLLSITSCNVVIDNELNTPVTQPKIEVPSGTYTLTTMGMEETVTFKSNNIIEWYNVINGKRVLKYSISDDGKTITLTNIVTNTTVSSPFKYIKEQECVVFGDAAFFK